MDQIHAFSKHAMQMAKGRKSLIGEESGSYHYQIKLGCLSGVLHITAWRSEEILLEEG